MSVLTRIAFYQGRRDEIPNQELARDLARREDVTGIAEIAGHLWDKEPNVRSDCLKVLYEAGYERPDLVAPYTGDFLRLLGDRNNRMVWGGMIALSTVAALRPNELFAQRAAILGAMAKGSVITVDAGVKALAAVAAAHDDYGTELLPHLLDHLKTCRPVDLARHAEAILPALGAADREGFATLLETRLDGLSPAQAARTRRLIRRARTDRP